MTYDEVIKQRYGDRYGLVQTNLMKKEGLFPDMGDRTKTLDMGRTLVLQLIFGLKAGFLEEVTSIFSLAYSKHTFEKLILSLEEDGWILSRNTKAFGKAFILSDNALYFLYNAGAGSTEGGAPQAKVSSDSFPNEKKLKAYKVINGIVARHALDAMLGFIGEEFSRRPREYRMEYTKSQFLTSFVFPASKGSSPYSTKDVSEFLSEALENLSKDEALLGRYRQYVKEMKLALAGESMEDLQIKHCFYRDYANATLTPRENALCLLRKVLTFPNNIFRGNPYVFWNDLYQASGEARGIKADFQRFYDDELLRNYSIVKRNLGNTKSDNEEELQKTLSSIGDLERAIQRGQERQEKYREYFECMAFKCYDEHDIPTFEPKEIHLGTLKNNACYISNIRKAEGEKPIITFAVLDDSLDEIAAPLLFKRLEYIFLYYRNNLIAFDFEIHLYTYKKSGVPVLREKLRTITQQFKDIGEYALLLPKLMDLSIIPTEIHPGERFQIMQAFQKERRF